MITANLTLCILIWFCGYASGSNLERKRAIEIKKQIITKHFEDTRIIFNYYGEKYQLNKLVEEIGELLVAISKNDTKNIAEEMADVAVLLSQFEFHSQFGDKIIRTRFFKAHRQVERIKEEND